MFANNEPEPGPVECRICHSKTTKDLILSPCLCKGSMAYVHFRCLERWLNYSSRDTCELCSYKFNVLLTRRYSCLQSVRVWLRHPTNRAFILCDLAIGLILTSLTLSLILVCFLGLTHFVKEGYDQGIQSLWSEGIIDFFLVILLAGYLVTMYSMARDHIRPWYMWWSRCNNVRLVLDKNVIVTLSQESSESVLVEKDDKPVKNQTYKQLRQSRQIVKTGTVQDTKDTGTVQDSKDKTGIVQDSKVINCAKEEDIKRISDSEITDGKADIYHSEFVTPSASGNEFKICPSTESPV